MVEKTSNRKRLLIISLLFIAVEMSKNIKGHKTYTLHDWSAPGASFIRPIRINPKPEIMLTKPHKKKLHENLKVYLLDFLW